MSRPADGSPANFAAMHSELFAAFQEMPRHLSESFAPLSEDLDKWTKGIQIWAEQLRGTLVPENLVGMEERSIDLLATSEIGIPIAWVVPPLSFWGQSHTLRQVLASIRGQGSSRCPRLRR